MAMGDLGTRSPSGWGVSARKALSAWRIDHSGRIGFGQPLPSSIAEQIERFRRQRFTGKQIAKETGVSPATVSRVLRQASAGCAILNLP